MLYLREYLDHETAVFDKYFFFIILLLTSSSFNLYSQSLPSFAPDDSFEYFAESQNLRELLISLSSNYGLAIEISPKVDDRIKGHFGPLPPEEFLDHLAKIYNLSWYYDGAVLYIYKNDELISELIQLGPLSESELRRSIQLTGIWDKRFSWQASPSKGVVYVSGPPRYIELVKQFTEALKQQQTTQKPLFLDIIPLKYATAIDRVIEYRDQSIQVPGVASILQNMLAGAPLNLEPESGKSSNKTNRIAEPSSSLARIEAEPSLNAIIVRDNQSRLPFYRELIRRLDVPQERVEIGVIIIDVSVNNSDQIGIDWAAGSDLGLNSNAAVNLSTTGSLDDNFFNLNTGTDFSTLLTGNRLNYVLANVRLLEGRGDAQIISRPTLLTQENIQAVLDDSSTFYVKLEGTETTDLRDVSYGTQLRLTPRILGEKYEPNPEIQLSIHIEDGSVINDGDVGGLPSTRNTVIDTLATVPHGRSLLIGGVFRNSVENNVRKVPFLGDIPVIGALFRSESTQTRKVMRLFIVEPKLVREDQPTIGFPPTNTIKSLTSVNECINKDEALEEQAKMSTLGISSWLESCGDDQVRIRILNCTSADKATHPYCEEAH